MDYRGENGKPWHGLGVEIKATDTIDEILAKCGMNVRVVKNRIYRADNTVIPGYMEIKREDSNNPFMIASDRYHPMQYVDMVSLFRDFCESGEMQLDTVGLLKNGAVCWALAKIGENFTLAGGDQVNGNVLIYASHDGSLMTEAKLTTVRVICWNTLECLIRTLVGGVLTPLGMAKSKSRKDKIAAIKEARETLRLSKQQFSQFHEIAQELSEAKVDFKGPEVIHYLTQLTSPKLLKLQSAKLKIDDFNRQGKGILESILSSPGSEMDSAKNTWWGVVNGVTNYFDHEAGTRIQEGDNRQYAREDNRLTSSWFGQGARMKETALELALQYC